MTLSEFIKECQETLEKEGDREINIRTWSYTDYKYFEPEIGKNEELNCYVIS